MKDEGTEKNLDDFSVYRRNEAPGKASNALKTK